jgi:hypothetical protein
MILVLVAAVRNIRIAMERTRDEESVVVSQKRIQKSFTKVDAFCMNTLKNMPE